MLTVLEDARWRTDEIIRDAGTLDFTKPFLPESLARSASLAFLSPAERLVLNQIRGRGYVHFVAVAHEFILAFLLGPGWPSEDDKEAEQHRRPLLQVATQEMKHVILFRQFRRAFDSAAAACDNAGAAEAVVAEVLNHDPLAVALIVLHMEWASQRHYLESLRDEAEVDPLFLALLRHHWQEDADHTRLDGLVVETLARRRDEPALAAAVEDYLSLVRLIDQRLLAQVRMDRDCLARATGRPLKPAERETFLRVQHQACRWTFLGAGMTHPRFLQFLGNHSAAARRTIERVAPIYC